MRRIVPLVTVFTALVPMSVSASAQDLSALMARSDVTMQDIENGALRNTMNRVSPPSDSVPTPGQGNAFYGLQEGQYNRVDATQTGIGNVIRIMQSGVSNSAVIAQSGSFNQITLKQGR